MTDNATPTLPKPAKSTVAAIQPATTKQPSFWLGLAALVPAVVALLADHMGEIIQHAGPLLTDRQRLELTLLAFILGLCRSAAVKHEQAQATARGVEWVQGQAAVTTTARDAAAAVQDQQISDLQSSTPYRTGQE